MENISNGDKHFEKIKSDICKISLWFDTVEMAQSLRIMASL